MTTSTIIKNILLDQKKIIELAKIAFEGVDEDGSGEIEEPELGKVLVDISNSLGGDPPTEDDIKEVFKHLDADRSGTVDLNEFTLLIKDILYAMLEDVQ